MSYRIKLQHQSQHVIYHNGNSLHQLGYSEAQQTD